MTGIVWAGLLVAIAVELGAIIALAVRVDTLVHRVDRLSRRIDNQCGERWHNDPYRNRMCTKPVGHDGNRTFLAAR